MFLAHLDLDLEKTDDPSTDRFLLKFVVNMYFDNFQATQAVGCIQLTLQQLITGPANNLVLFLDLFVKKKIFSYQSLFTTLHSIPTSYEKYLHIL